MTVVNHNQRVMKRLRNEGYCAEVVERWDSFSRRRHDLFGFIDVLAVGNGLTLAIQVTSRSNMSSRRNKMRAAPELQAMCDAGWRVELWGFDKPASRWRLEVECVTPLNA
jgi:hypothetical protein